MAYIRVRDTGARVKGRPVRSYVVSWREPVRDEYGAVVPGKTVQRTETFKAEKPAKARLREIETHLDSGRGSDPSSQKAKANRLLGEYAKQYLGGLAGAIEPAPLTATRSCIALTSVRSSVVSQWLPSPPRTSRSFGLRY